MVSLTQRMLGVMAHVRRLTQEVEMRKPSLNRIVALLRKLSPSCVFRAIVTGDFAGS